MDKTYGSTLTFTESEKAKLFPTNTSYRERIAEAWYLTCMAYGIDYKNPPKIDKNFGSARKHST